MNKIKEFFKENYNLDITDHQINFIFSSQNKLGNIKDYINAYLNVNILDESRRLETVRGRFLFYKICKRQKISNSNIYDYLKKDHSTLLYYERGYNQGIQQSENEKIINSYE